MQDTKTAGPERRHFVEVFLGAGVIASLGSFLYPVLRYLIPPQTAELESDLALAGKVGDLKPGTGKIFRFGSRPALLVLASDGTYHALSAVCTHLGCTVQYRSENCVPLNSVARLLGRARSSVGSVPCRPPVSGSRSPAREIIGKHLKDTIFPKSHDGIVSS